MVPIAAQIHFALITERYHDPLRCVLNKLITYHPTAMLHFILHFTSLPMSHIVGPEAYRTAIFALEVQPGLRVCNYEQQSQSATARKTSMIGARSQYKN